MSFFFKIQCNIWKIFHKVSVFFYKQRTFKLWGTKDQTLDRTIGKSTGWDSSPKSSKVAQQ